MGTRPRSSVVCILPLALGLVACGDSATGPVEALVLEGENFVFHSTTLASSPSEMEAGLALAELLLQRLHLFVEGAHTPDLPIRVTLHGDFAGQGPYVDAAGVHLYRYTVEENGYWALIAHEMVHAFNANWFVDHEAWTWPTGHHFDEAFAELAAQEIDPDKTGFPFYGFPEDVVVGTRVSAGEHIPPDVLRQHHDALNQPCEVQAYPQRASWLRYVDETFGRTALLALAYSDRDRTDDVVHGITGSTLAEIDAGWESWIRERFAAFPGAETLAAAYRARTSWARLCAAGVDW